MKEETMTEVTEASPKVLELIERADLLASDHSAEVQEAVRLGRAKPLSEPVARRLYSRIIEILVSVTEGSSIASNIQSAVEAAVEAHDRPQHDDDDVTLVARYGLDPRSVTPTPTFNGVTVEMTEGYVDVSNLHFWEENDRYVLHVQEFTERHDREPTEDEVLAILTGELVLPSLNKEDPFKIRALANSIARKGVERPPIIDSDGVLYDGHRRTAAARYVVANPEEFDDAARDRARWVRVWRAENATKDQIEAIVVALNFEEDHKEPWPEYVKARRVADRFTSLKNDVKGRYTQKMEKEIKRSVAAHFAIRVQEVTRYLRMVGFAEDFEAYHTDEGGRDPASVRYRADEIFQWFYEIQAGRGDAKLTNRLDQDDDLKAVVYDLMFEVLDSGAQVRSLHKVVADDEALSFLFKAHENLNDAELASSFLQDALEEARRKSSNRSRSRSGFDGFLRSIVQRFGATPPDYWGDIDVELLKALQPVLHSALGTIEGQLASRSRAGTDSDA